MEAESNNKKIKALRSGVVKLSGVLDERYNILKHASGLDRSIESTYYQGLTKAIEILGGDWQRDENGKHKVFIAGVGGKAIDD